MTPTSTILDKIATLLQNDATTIAHATLAVKVHLAKAAFVPGPGLTVGSFTEANFTGATAKLGATGAQQEFNDPATGNRIVQLVEPAGGWHWQATDNLQLPQTIYGFYVTDNGSTVVYGSQLLPQPITITAAPDGVDIAQVRFAFNPNSPT